MTQLAVTGATGTMGTHVIETAQDRSDVDVALAVNRGDPDASVAGIQVQPAADLGEALGATDLDVLVDFTGPASSVEYVRAAAAAGVGTVVGTTGFDEDQEAALREAATDVPVLVAPNFSRGIGAVHAALREVVARLDGYDIEVLETHHNRKRDAPSGTALGLVDVIEAAGGPVEQTHGRSGDDPREPGEIGVHARRAGTITGEHEVLLADNDEVVRLVHRAESRTVFAAGALDAAAWLSDKPAGWYRFADVLEEG